jgi:uncharacterized protein (TIGR03437 family)
LSLCNCPGIGKYRKSMRLKFPLFVLVLLAPALAQTPAAPAIVTVGTSSDFGGFAGAAAPGSYIEIKGANLAGTTREWTDSDFSDGAAPTLLDGVSVSINGEPAFVSFVSPGKVNAQVPDDIPTGGTVPVVVSYQDQASDPADLAINPVEPGLRAPDNFKVNGRQYVAAIHASDGTLVSVGGIPDVPAAPAMPNEVLIFYGTGFGPVQQGPVAGQIANGQAELAGTFAMAIGNAPAIVQYAGLAVGRVGIYQFTVRLPGNLPGGDQPVQITLNGSPITLQNLFLPVGGPPPPPPTNVVATAGDGSASIAFRPPPPPPNGGQPFTGFTAT